MKKCIKTNMLRKIIAIVLVFVMCFSTYAAVVSDNDSSAFITKAELNALKKSYQKQINDYHANIDKKIDNTIAAYLNSFSGGGGKVQDVQNHEETVVKDGIADISGKVDFLDLTDKGTITRSSLIDLAENGITQFKCMFDVANSPTGVDSSVYLGTFNIGGTDRYTLNVTLGNAATGYNMGDTFTCYYNGTWSAWVCLQKLKKVTNGTAVFSEGADATITKDMGTSIIKSVNGLVTLSGGIGFKTPTTGWDTGYKTIAKLADDDYLNKNLMACTALVYGLHTSTYEPTVGRLNAKGELQIWNNEAVNSQKTGEFIFSLCWEAAN